jgi:CubicO group peptidase (beta-lactamase class C family)
MNLHMATGHNATLAPVPNWDLAALAGAGALRSSANNMLTFLEAFLGYKDSPLAPAMKAMLNVRRQINTKFEVALGWNLLGEIVWHDGATGGFSSFTGFDPKTRLGVVVLSNALALPGISDIGIHLLNPKVPLANPEPGPQRAEIRLDPAILDRYTGRYQWTDRIFEITHDNERLFLQAIQAAGHAIAAPKFELFAESEKSFFSKMTGSQITFETGPDGRATSLTMRRPGREPTLAARLP